MVGSFMGKTRDKDVLCIHQLIHLFIQKGESYDYREKRVGYHKYH
jgi:hypothetical protein